MKQLLKAIKKERGRDSKNIINDGDNLKGVPITDGLCLKGAHRERRGRKLNFPVANLRIPPQEMVVNLDYAWNALSFTR